MGYSRPIFIRTHRLHCVALVNAVHYHPILYGLTIAICFTARREKEEFYRKEKIKYIDRTVLELSVQYQYSTKCGRWHMAGDVRQNVRILALRRGYALHSVTCFDSKQDRRNVKLRHAEDKVDGRAWPVNGTKREQR